MRLLNSHIQIINGPLLLHANTINTNNGLEHVLWIEN